MENCSSCKRLIIDQSEKCPFCHQIRWSIPRSVKLLGASATAFVMSACYGIGPEYSKSLSEDVDGDQVTAFDGDCNDYDASIHPMAEEICDDQIDNNCNGFVDQEDPDCIDDTEDTGIEDTGNSEDSGGADDTASSEDTGEVSDSGQAG